MSVYVKAFPVFYYQCTYTADSVTLLCKQGTVITTANSGNQAMFLEPQGKMTDILCDPHPLHQTTSTSVGCNSNMLSVQMGLQDRNSFLTQLMTAVLTKMEADTTVHTKNLKSTLIQLRYFKVIKTRCHESHYTHGIRQMANLQWR